MGVSREGLQLNGVYKTVFFTTSHENLYQVLQVIAIVKQALVCVE